MLINILFILLLPLLFVGIILRVKAIWAGRKGAPLLQPFHDFIRLLRKGEVISSSSSFIFDLSPAIALAAILGAAMLLPFGSYNSIISFRGDIFLFAYLLAMAKLFSVLAAMDTGSSFEGMGASRELAFTIFLEPAFIIIMACIAYGAGLGSITELLLAFDLSVSQPWSLIFAVLIILSFFIMLLIEGCRVPFDDPATHLELTMVHEVMVLDNSGINFAYTLYASALKMCIYAAMIVQLLLPEGLSAGLLMLFFTVGMVINAIAVGIIEALMPRFRMIRNLELAIIPLSLALLILSAMLMYQGGVLHG